MSPDKKAAILETAKAHVTAVCTRLRETLAEIQESILESEARLRGPAGPTYALEHRLYMHKLARREAAASLATAPYFSRCDITLPTGERKTLYFSKHSRVEEDIYSWVAPAAALRFEELGEASFKLKDGFIKRVFLDRKDQYVIADAHIVYMSAEDAEDGRTLIHQERLTAQDRGFVLPDIVAQMEKAQDQVIRAPAHGPLLIAGPAGSGKTTLALHRVAYLTQSPDTAADFTDTDLIVFVQDASAKAYFGGLLPELGIRDVEACTYEEWALKILELPEWRARATAHGEERADDEYRAAKRRAVKQMTADLLEMSGREPQAFLSDLYRPHFDRSQLALLDAQLAGGELDRHDLTALLRRGKATEGAVKQRVEYYDRISRGRLVKKTGRKKVQYGLVVIDEIENWGSEELALVRGCVSDDTDAIVYVGDLSQRTRLGAIASWEEAGEAFDEGRRVTLHKVYRNTRQVVEFARNMGFAVEVPDGLPEGPAVTRHESVPDVTAYCRAVTETAAGRLVGVLAKGEAALTEARRAFAGVGNVKVMTVEQAQGVEFDTVVLLGLADFMAVPQGYGDAALADERARVNRDLLYVAITRAMRELHVLG